MDLDLGLGIEGLDRWGYCWRLLPWKWVRGAWLFSNPPLIELASPAWSLHVYTLPCLFNRPYLWWEYSPERLLCLWWLLHYRLLRFRLRNGVLSLFDFHSWIVLVEVIFLFFVMAEALIIIIILMGWHRLLLLRDGLRGFRLLGNRLCLLLRYGRDAFFRSRYLAGGRDRLGLLSLTSTTLGLLELFHAEHIILGILFYIYIQAIVQIKIVLGVFHNLEILLRFFLRLNCLLRGFDLHRLYNIIRCKSITFLRACWLFSCICTLLGHIIIFIIVYKHWELLLLTVLYEFIVNIFFVKHFLFK